MGCERLRCIFLISPAIKSSESGEPEGEIDCRPAGWLMDGVALIVAGGP
jgi:hypothetical protein